jgi:hypothetical protein
MKPSALAQRGLPAFIVLQTYARRADDEVVRRPLSMSFNPRCAASLAHKADLAVQHRHLALATRHPSPSSRTEIMTASKMSCHGDPAHFDHIVLRVGVSDPKELEEAGEGKLASRR